MRADLPVLILLAIAVFGAFASSLGGDFVYDDQNQIVRNHLIQDPAFLGKALTSDVWAFKGEKDAAWSNYWRPFFVLYLAVCFQLFELEPFGWHVVNLLLHLLVCALAYGVLRRFDIGRPLAAVIALLFAVHPVHVESVAWIAGAPDLLMAAPFLAALWLVTYRDWRRWAALAFFALSLLAKEVAIVLPVVVALMVFLSEDDEDGRDEGGVGSRLRHAALVAAPFFVVAGIYFAVRRWMLGTVAIDTPWEVGPVELVLSAPSVLAFYIRQCLWPVELGPSYPLRVITPDTVSAETVWLPLLLVGVFLVAVWSLRRHATAVLGVAIFGLTLLPAANLDALHPEQIVHDRYLYLPLLGFLMLLLVSFERVFENRKRIALGVAAVLIVGLAVQSLQYSRVWTSDLALWQRGIQSDPTSAANWGQYGNALLAEGQVNAAKNALDKALAIEPVTSAYLDRAQIAMRQSRFSAAESDLLSVIASYPDNFLALEQLAVVYQRQRRLPEAAMVLENARQAVPYRRCAFSANLAVVQVLGGRREQAREILESARELVGSELNAVCPLVLFHLGTLYLEDGETEKARQAYRDYLDVTARATDQENLSRREIALQRVN